MNKSWTQRMCSIVAEKTVIEDTCARCGKPLTGETRTLEHMIPKTDSGSNAQYNLCLLCKRCNETRGSDISTRGIVLYPYLRDKYRLTYDVMLMAFSDILSEQEMVSYENVNVNKNKYGVTRNGEAAS